MDVVRDLLPYLRLMASEDAVALREKVKAKIDALESSHTIGGGHHQQ